MKYASPAQRAMAFWFDFVVLATLILGVGRVLWEIMPGSDVRVSAMQLYTPKDYNNFLATAAFATILILFYSIGMPAWSRAQATIGQRLFKVYVGRPDGTKTGGKEVAKRFGFLLFKCFLVFGLGPILAIVGGSFATSMLGLLAPIFVWIVLPALSWSSPERAGVVERACGIRYFSK